MATVLQFLDPPSRYYKTARDLSSVAVWLGSYASRRHHTYAA